MLLAALLLASDAADTVGREDSQFRLRHACEAAGQVARREFRQPHPGTAPGASYFTLQASLFSD